uniref:Uncharacterized protein n=1 Tax=Anopheles christyi TaxID=43041 RepID=A0A182KI23_9DIPT
MGFGHKSGEEARARAGGDVLRCFSSHFPLSISFSPVFSSFPSLSLSLSVSRLFGGGSPQHHVRTESTRPTKL